MYQRVNVSKPEKRDKNQDNEQINEKNTIDVFTYKRIDI